MTNFDLWPEAQAIKSHIENMGHINRGHPACCALCNAEPDPDMARYVAEEDQAIRDNNS